MGLSDADYGDIDGDGTPDVIGAAHNPTDDRGQSNQNQIYLNNGSGHFQNGTSGRLPNELIPTRAISLRDIDSNGPLDLIAGYMESEINLDHRATSLKFRHFYYCGALRTAGAALPALFFCSPYLQ